MKEDVLIVIAIGVGLVPISYLLQIVLPEIVDELIKAMGTSSKESEYQEEEN